MEQHPVYRCRCRACRSHADTSTKQLHARINLLVSTLDERQRRLYVGLESQRLGHGGDRTLAEITGLSVDTVAAGRRELETAQLSTRTRAPGGGRPRAEKKTRRS